jgi:hypothetical protein
MKEVGDIAAGKNYILTLYFMNLITSFIMVLFGRVAATFWLVRDPAALLLFLLLHSGGRPFYFG